MLVIAMVKMAAEPLPIRTSPHILHDHSCQHHSKLKDYTHPLNWNTVALIVDRSLNAVQEATSIPNVTLSPDPADPPPVRIV